MKRIGFVLFVLGAVGLLWPGMMQVAWAQTTDPSGLELIQAIPERNTRFFSEQTALRILNSLADVALLQWDLEDVNPTVTDLDTGDERTVHGGTFGRLIREELLDYTPGEDDGMLVEHLELVQTPGLTPEFDKDFYRLIIGRLEIDLELSRLDGRPLKNLEWGIRRLEVRKFDDEGTSAGELRVLALSFVNRLATLTDRLFSPNGRFLEGTIWEFERGNPEPVDQRALRSFRRRECN